MPCAAFCMGPMTRGSQELKARRNPIRSMTNGYSFCDMKQERRTAENGRQKLLLSLGHRGEGSGSDRTAVVERQGGLDAVLDNIDQAQEETAASAGAGWINDFLLRGARTWRRMHRH